MSLSKVIFFIILIFTAVLILRLPTVSTNFFNMDEGIGAVAANAILDGGVYYRDAIDQRGPVTYYIYALVFKLFGRNNMAAIHCALILVILIISAFLYFIGVLIWDRRSACWAVLFFGFFSYAYSDSDMLAFHTEWSAILFNVIGAYLFLKYVFKNRSLLLVFSGVFFGSAFFSKQPALLEYLTTIVFFGVLSCIDRSGIKQIIRGFFCIISGFCLPLAIIVFYYYVNGSLRDLWFYFWEYNVKYYAAAISLLGRFKIAQDYLISEKSFFRVNLLLTMSFVGGAIMTVWGLTRNFKKIDKKLLIDLYIISLGLSAYIGASYTGRSFGHYFIMILPAFCLIGARFIQELCELINTHRESKFAGKLIKVILIITITTGFMWPATRSFRKKLARIMKLHSYLNRYKFNTVYSDLKNGGAFLYPQKIMPLKERELYDISRYLISNSGSNEKIFVWGFYPEIYISTGRRPASRYTYCNFLTGLLPWVNTDKDTDTANTIVPGSWDIFMEEMKKNMPLFIVDTSLGDHRYYGKYPIGKFDRLLKFIQDYYRPEKVLFDYKGQPSFLLFKRK